MTTEEREAFLGWRANEAPTEEQLRYLARRLLNHLPMSRVMSCDVDEAVTLLKALHEHGRLCGAAEFMRL
jgi:hypothetical protein